MTSSPSAHDERRLASFVELSETMLDVTGLSADTARAFLAMVTEAAPPSYGRDAPETSPVDVLLAVFERLRDESAEDLERRMAEVAYADLTLGPVLKSILVVWYNGSLGSVVAPVASYADALVWDAISAQPPGVPGLYYGSWAYPPPQPIADDPDREDR